MKILSITTVMLIAVLAGLAQDDPIRVETNLVTLNVSVSDNRGKAIKGLSKNDFVILDNGIAQGLDSFSRDDAPVSLGVIYDLHKASEENSSNILAALRTFSSSLGKDEDLFVNVIGERGSLTTDFVPNEKQIRDNVVNGDKAVNNSLYDAIFEASKKLSGSRNQKRVLVLLTDGADRSSHHSLKELKLHLRGINMPVYSITFGGSDKRQFGYSDIFRDSPRQSFLINEATELDRAVVDELSRSSGGQAIEGDVRNRVYLTALLSSVFGEVREQYVLGFYPEKLDGKYHKLKVTVTGQKDRKLRVSNREGYQSPKKS